MTVVLALRKRILSDSSGDGPERANAAYREWRGARVERLCTDAARRAFHLGVVTASKGRSIRFFAVPNDAPCDLCAHDSDVGRAHRRRELSERCALPTAACGLRLHCCPCLRKS